MIKIKTFKLHKKEKEFGHKGSQGDLIVSKDDFVDLKIGDVVEIYSLDDKFSRLIIQVSNFMENIGKVLKKSILLDKTIAETFQLRPLIDVVVSKIQPEHVLLDSVELFFKDQYLARSDMWRLKRCITNTTVYLNKKVEFNNVRCQVFEMWQRGVRMASGYIGEETKVVFRSASSMVYLFLQMSSEMWDYDINGDLYFEKAIKGFLTDLFNKWKIFNCSHDVTIVLFSRTFFDANSIHDFPEELRECLQQDSSGRFYEDYYRVAVQNERFDDWMPVLIYLRKLFNLYENEVVHYHAKRNSNTPRGYNSSASQGNFLEVLNMSLNVFERHNLDRSFDRTGQLSVVISPGVGVYEVELDLTNITKQRIIDNGIGSDLVCLGEQPLHAVPLFKFNSKINNINDRYNMPHWINLSFYCSKRRFSSNFIPRLKVPVTLQLKSVKNKDLVKDKKDKNNLNFNNMNEQNIKDYRQIDFDEFDEQVFRTPRPNSSDQNSQFQSIAALNRKLSEIKRRAQDGETIEEEQREDEEFDDDDDCESKELSSSLTLPMSPLSNCFRDTVDGLSMSTRKHPRHNSAKLSSSVDSKSARTLKDVRAKTPSKEDKERNNEIISTKTLINPFDPAHVTIKLNSNRRRWTHVFPLGPTGIFMQQHHYQAMPQNTACSMVPFSFIEYPPNNLKNLSIDQIDAVKKRISECGDGNKDVHQRFYRLNTRSTRMPAKGSMTDNTSVWAWGATGEQEWTPAMTTGVDWKSLVMPACLPITTDFMPDCKALENDFYHYTYDLIPDDRSYALLITKESQALKMFDQVLYEIIFQRLQQGFQIIIVPQELMTQLLGQKFDVRHTFMLSIGRIYHHVTMWDLKITITSYHSKQPLKVNPIQYCYRIRTPDNETYGVSWVEYYIEKLDNYKWNYLDNYICVQGDGEYPLIESLKHWRFRLLVLPTMHTITKRIIDNYAEGREDLSSDLYLALTGKEKIDLQNSFLQLIETINTKRQHYKFATNATANSGDLKCCRLSLICDSFVGEKSAHNSAEEVSNGKYLPINSFHVQLFQRFKNEFPSFRNQGDTKDMPTNLFVSMAAIQWLFAIEEKIISEAHAEIVFHIFLKNKLIRHASGLQHQFKRGYYLYCVVSEENEQYFDKPCPEDSRPFQLDWMEVGVVQQNICKSSDAPSKDFVLDYKIDPQDFTFKNMTIDIDNGSGGRTEWINLKYHSLYDPEQAFEMIIEWMACTGNAIPELVCLWAKRNKSTGLHIVPIPWDPFALPFSSRSDPLRGPIYIALKFDFLKEKMSEILESENLTYFQEKILVKFGFIPFHDPTTDNQRQFVHVSGSIFVMLPNKNASLSPNKNQNKRGKFLKVNDQDVACSPHEEYITRHFSGMQQKNTDDTLVDAKVGFLWCWNYALTKRWKTSVTGDENSMRKIMRDFRAFCSNKNDRLSDFYFDQHEI